MQVFQSLCDPICQGVGSASPRLDMERANALWPMCRSHTATYRFKCRNVEATCAYRLVRTPTGNGHMPRIDKRGEYLHLVRWGQVLAKSAIHHPDNADTRP